MGKRLQRLKRAPRRKRRRRRRWQRSNRAGMGRRFWRTRLLLLKLPILLYELFLDILVLYIKFS